MPEYPWFWLAVPPEIHHYPIQFSYRITIFFSKSTISLRRFCVGDRFYLCDNKILCEYDYEERLVFASMAANPSGLAHIRRQVSGLQVGLFWPCLDTTSLFHWNYEKPAWHTLWIVWPIDWPLCMKLIVRNYHFVNEELKTSLLIYSHTAVPIT